MLPFIASIGALVPGLFGKKVEYKTAQRLGWVALAILLIAVLSVGKCAYDASVVNEHEVKVRAERAEREQRADRKADEATAPQNAQQAETKAQLDEATHAAAKADPAGAADVVGPVSQSYYDTLRRRQKEK